MMPQEPSRTARLEARIAPEALAIVKRAAELQGRSISDFVVAAVQKEAVLTIEATQIVLSVAADQLRFVETLINPPEPNEALRRAARRHAETVEVR